MNQIVTNSLGMKFVLIPPGTFLMGSPKEEKYRYRDETQHKVTLTKGFYMGVYAVTQEEWQAVVDNNPSVFKGQRNLPVDAVCWEDCDSFVSILRKKDEKPYRMPTEAEWEYACRAGTTTMFHFGNTISTDKANYDDETGYGTQKKGLCRQKTIPVGSFPPNAFGLCDMHGNIREWCADWYGDYSQDDTVDPVGPLNGHDRVLRGGSWGDGPVYCRSAFRHHLDPQRHCHDLGFRVCFGLDALTPWQQYIKQKMDRFCIEASPENMQRFLENLGIRGH